MARSSLVVAPALTAFLLFGSACSKDSAPEARRPDPLPDPAMRCADFDPLRVPLFGDTHVHTALSLDANLGGTQTSQKESYAYAKGAEIDVPPYDQDGNALRARQLARPLDYVALSDHAEFLGTVKVCLDPSSSVYSSQDCVNYRENPDSFLEFTSYLTLPPNLVAYPELCGNDGQICIEAGMEVWADIIADAESEYDRSDACEFTAFVAYEWTGAPELANLHRNVIFKNEAVPEQPESYFDRPYVQELWASLREDCIDSGYDCDALTIPHNSNLARGIFFEDRMANGEPFDEAYATERNFMEPVIELMQHKGNSECLTGFPVEDELCLHEVLPYNSLGDLNQGVQTPPIPSDYVRGALGQGMQHEEELGVNPFQYGLVSSTDTHISTGGGIRELDYPGHGGAGQNNDELPLGLVDDPYLNPGGLAGVWAEENTRPAIFDAMRRKETFGTTGPRIVPRFFGGWSYADTLCDSADFVQTGYDDGVPMGGELSAQPNPGNAPKFAVSAAQDAGTEEYPGTALQYVQIVKGWLDGGEYQVAIYDVAGNENNGADVDLGTCEQSGEGSASLCAVWEDPDFDPAQRAYYYARVVENPSCRWTTYQCNEAGYDCDATEPRPIDEACCDPVLGLNRDICEGIGDGCDSPGALPSEQRRCCLQQVQPVIQELAWTSPIWYQPPPVIAADAT